MSTDHIEGNDAARQILDVLMPRVDDFCDFLAVKQLLFHPERHVLHEHVMLDHVVSNDLCYHRTPDTDTVCHKTLHRAHCTVRMIQTLNDPGTAQIVSEIA